MSDLHADDRSFTEPLLPDAPNARFGRSSWIQFGDSSRSAPDPLRTVSKLIRDAQIRADFMILPGDICHKANGQALTKAWARIQEIAAELGGAEVIATVGNHDLDSRYRGHRYDPTNVLRGLQPPFPTSSAEDVNAYWANGFAVLIRENIRLVLVNSCAFHANRPSELEHGRVAQHALESFREYLRDAGRYDFNVLVCHHPPIPFPEGSEGPEDYMRNGENLLQALEDDSQHWLVVHGHRHVARLRYAPGDYGSPILFSAGTFGAVIDPSLSSRLRNQVHLVELSANVCAEVPMGGRVFSWDYTVDVGWEPARKLDGLPARCGFGYRGQPSALAARVAGLVASSDDPVKWTDIEAALPELGFLMPSGYERLLQELERNHALRLLPAPDNPIELARRKR